MVDSAVLPKLVPVTALHLSDWNPRSITDPALESLARSIQSDPSFKWPRPILARENGEIYAGHQRYKAVLRLGWEEVPAIIEDVPEAIAKERAGRDNNQWGIWDDGGLSSLLVDLQGWNAELGDLGFDQEEMGRLLARLGGGGDGGDSVGTTPNRASLSDRFLIPPFSVLDARQGYWQERKRQWLALGIESELGRGDQPNTSARAGVGDEPTYRQIKASPSGSLQDAAILGPDGHTVRGDGKGRGLARKFGQDLMRGEHVVGGGNGLLGEAEQARSHYQGDARAIKDHKWQVEQDARPASRILWDMQSADEGSRKNLAAQPQSGTSIFDPVLCELAYRWFSPLQGHILDPFAGGSVRGIVASVLGRSYTGVDLSGHQLAANRQQAEAIVPDAKPCWIEGDSRELAILAPGEYDLLFSCPPYADLEVYSDDPRDLSTMPYAEFLAAYRTVIESAASMLMIDRFACFVVGDVRDKRGHYRGLVRDTITAFMDVGLRFYNDAVLITAVGSLPLRVGKQFEGGRKLGKTHQNVLVFVKGDARKATKACGPVDVNWPEEWGGDDGPAS